MTTRNSISKAVHVHDPAGNRVKFIRFAGISGTVAYEINYKYDVAGKVVEERSETTRIVIGYGTLSRPIRAEEYYNDQLRVSKLTFIALVLPVIGSERSGSWEMIFLKSEKGK